MKNFLALLFVIVTQVACAAFYAMDPPPSFGPRDQHLRSSDD